MRIFLGILTLLLSLSAFAQSSTGSFYGSFGLTGGLGTTKNKDETIPKCDMLFTELDFKAGIKFAALAPILQASYRYVGQRTDPSDVGDINVGGMGYLLGGGVAADFSNFGFAVVYDFIGSFELAKKSSGGTEVSYTTPKGFHVNVSYSRSPTWSYILNFSQVKWEKKKTGSTETEIADNPFDQTLYGIGIAYKF